VFDLLGLLMLQIQTIFIAQIFPWTEATLTVLWTMGKVGIARVNWDSKGEDLANLTSWKMIGSKLNG
jgi:hypothetical protein